MRIVDLLIVVLGLGFVSAAEAVNIGAAHAAPMTAHAPVIRAVGPAAASPGGAAAPAPLPDIVTDGGGIHVANTFAPFNGTVAINSTTMSPLTPAQRARNRGEQPCSFTGSFTLKNVGGSRADSVDVYTWVEQPQGPQVGKIGDMGYSNPPLMPGGTYSWTFAQHLAPGSYVFWLVIDPQNRLKQATPGPKKYQVRLLASCGIAGMPRMTAPNALAPAANGIGGAPLRVQSAIPGRPPSGGIGIMSAPAHAFMRIDGVGGDSTDSAHRGWIELQSTSWQDRGPAPGGNGCRQLALSATMLLEKASSQLAMLASSGRATTITIDDSAGRRALRDALVTSISTTGAGARPSQSLAVVGAYCP